MIILFKRGSMKKNTLIFITLLTIFIGIIFLIGFILEKKLIIYISLVFIAILYIYVMIKIYYLQKIEQKYIQEQIEVAKVNVFNTENVIIMIIKEGKIVWANDLAYEEFPVLLSDRTMDFLIDNNEEDVIKYNNKIYHILQKGKIYFLLNITEEYRKQRTLQNLQTIIGVLQIDNISDLKQMMNTVDFLEFYSNFNQELISIFEKNGIFYQEISDGKYQLNIPYHYLQQEIENRFEDLGNLIDKYHDQEIVVSTTMGIAYNYPDIAKTGIKAREAFDLAISRGGAQIVVFNNEEKQYFGGGITKEKGISKFRARMISNTLTKVAKQKDIIYIVTHEKPDADAIAGLLLMYLYLIQDNPEIRILIDSEESIEYYNLYNLGIDLQDKIITNYVIDKTKKNMLVVVDTQSLDIVSHPNIIKDVEEMIVIDHHQTPKNYFRGNIFSWIEPTASSTSELVTLMSITANRVSENKNVNNMAILGILTDTNKFKYRITNQTLDVLMNLVENGGSLNEMLESMYLTKDMFKYKYEIISKAQFYNKFLIAEVSGEYPDVILSIAADNMLEVKDIEGAVVICETDNQYRIKLRTKKTTNAKILIEEFGGGGHASQGAAVLNEETKNKFIEKLKNY